MTESHGQDRESTINPQAAEAVFFDRICRARTAGGRIPMEADIRRATPYVPTRVKSRFSPSEYLDPARACAPRDGWDPIDPHMSEILSGKFRATFIRSVAHRPSGRVLDICCGPGWLALELGRSGQTVEAYDLSPAALEMAQRMLDENPYREGFGKVSYHLADVSTVDLGSHNFDAVSGWSAFHHIPDLDVFVDRVWRALTPGGVIATLDDLPVGRMERFLGRLFKLLLPTWDRTYRDKVIYCFNLLRGRQTLPSEIFSPMEIEKHDAVEDICRLWYEKFEVTVDVTFGAFSLQPAMHVAGPNWFRYGVAHLLVSLDRLLCKLHLCRGGYRVMIGRKRTSSPV